ncbi:hypothetical protein QC761_0114370 (mitochondrion) [Podospora bellae-mahoneyi]|uniref:Uncharacterized protein n=1 Tax=Podospora bellae-mahoneyi TaxID=2093777 RepID=A0ABR0F4E8_9PEZI|nr:hypothetical protein QC761_0114370 [Podospora bellae-mahoneyi]
MFLFFFFFMYFLGLNSIFRVSDTSSKSIRGRELEIILYDKSPARPYLFVSSSSLQSSIIPKIYLPKFFRIFVKRLIFMLLILPLIIISKAIYFCWRTDTWTHI